MKKSRFNWSRLSRFMNIFIAIGVWVLVMMFIKFNTQVAANTKAAKEAAKDTKLIVSKQDATLQAIKDLATDIQLTEEQKTDIIICMLQVPIAQRTTDVQQQCRDHALGIGSSSTTPSPNANASNPSPTGSPSKDTSGEPSKAPADNPPKQNIIQKTGDVIMNIVHKVTNLL